METKIQANNDSRATFEADFADAYKNIPQYLFTENLTSMYENVLLWCRDYLNKPKDPLLAMALIGRGILPGRVMPPNGQQVPTISR